MDALFEPIASALGASVDQIKLIFCLLVAYPLGSLFVRIPSSKPNLRHLFSISVALIFFFPMLKLYFGFFQLLANVLATYYIAQKDKSKQMPWRVFFLTMGHLITNHVIRALKNQSYETFEVSGPQMVLVMKLTTFAWNVYDGRRPSEELDKWQSSKRVTQYPSLLAFLGYSFYFPGILVGPYLDYAEYNDLVHETMFKDQSIKSKHNSGRMLPPGRKRAAYTRMILGLAYLGAFVVFGGNYSFTATLRPEWQKMSFIKRLILFQPFGPVERSKYYALWTLTEGASILTGLGFTGFSSSHKPQWNGAANVIVSNIELPPNMKVMLDSWNMKTNVWLRECIYKRVTPRGKKPGTRTTVLTFLTSAVWHGIAAGYYCSFFLAAMVTTAARLARQNIRPLVLSPSPLAPLKPIYDVLTIFVTLIVLNYTAAPFILSTWSDSIAAWKVLNWYGHFIIFGGLAFFYIGGSKWLKGLQKSFGVLPPAHQNNKGSATTTNGKVGNGNGGTETPLEEKNFIVPPSIDKLVSPRS